MAFWAEKIELILPADDCKDVKTLDGRLRECLPLVERALDHQPFPSLAFLLTEAPKVSPFVELMRNSTKLLVGSISQHEWLLEAVDVIVATPDEALDFFKSGRLSSNSLKALMVDKSLEIVSQAKDFASFFQGFEVFESFRTFELHDREWFSSPRLAPMSSTILDVLGLKKSCAGWGDSCFLAGLGVFAWGLGNVAVQDFSDVPLLLPGLLRGSRTSSRPTLLAAPKRKVLQMSNLVRACAAEMGIAEGGSHVLVSSLEELVIPQHLERLVLVEAEKLLRGDASWKIDHLVKSFRHCLIGLHFSKRTKAVDELLKSTKSDIVPEPKVTMQGTCVFVPVSGGKEEKLEKVCGLLKEVWKPKSRVCIFCNSSETVDWLHKEMRLQEFNTWALHKGQEVDPQMYKERGVVLVTNVYKRAKQDITINYDLPESYEEYVERAGSDRAGRERLVFNIATDQSDDQSESGLRRRYEKQLAVKGGRSSQIYSDAQGFEKERKLAFLLAFSFRTGGRYVDLEEGNLLETLEKLVMEETWEAEEGILNSSTQVFLVIKKSLKRCTTLTKDQTLFSLYKVFQRVLRTYAGKLTARIPKTGTGDGIVAVATAMESHLRITDKDERVICYIVNTAEYCHETAGQLADNISKVIDPQFAENIDMSEEQDEFSGVITTALSALVMGLETRLENELAAMTRVPWGTIEGVGDQSEYVNGISSILSSSIPVIAGLLSPLYFQFFLDKLAASFAPRFYMNIYKCKRVSETGAQQMLLDARAVKTILLKIPALGGQAAAPASYTKYVTREIGKAEALLKVILSPIESIADTYHGLLPEGTGADFQRLLDLKGLKKADQQPLLDYFTKRGMGTLLPPSATTSPLVISKRTSAGAGPAGANRNKKTHPRGSRTRSAAAEREAFRKLWS